MFGQWCVARGVVVLGVEVVPEGVDGVVELPPVAAQAAPAPIAATAAATATSERSRSIRTSFRMHAIQPPGPKGSRRVG
jgi:hypothetical protein